MALFSQKFIHPLLIYEQLSLKYKLRSTSSNRKILKGESTLEILGLVIRV